MFCILSVESSWMCDEDSVCLISEVTANTIVSGQTSFLLKKSHLSSDTPSHVQRRALRGKGPSLWTYSPSEPVTINNNSKKRWCEQRSWLLGGPLLRSQTL